MSLINFFFPQAVLPWVQECSDDNKGNFKTTRCDKNTSVNFFNIVNILITGMYKINSH